MSTSTFSLQAGGSGMHCQMIGMSGEGGCSASMCASQRRHHHHHHLHLPRQGPTAQLISELDTQPQLSISTQRSCIVACWWTPQGRCAQAKHNSHCNRSYAFDTQHNHVFISTLLVCPAAWLRAVPLLLQYISKLCARCIETSVQYVSGIPLLNSQPHAVTW